MAGIPIDELDPFLEVTRDIVLPGMLADVTGGLTVGQVLDLLIGTAPGTYDTLQEIAEWIGTHGDEYDALLVTVAGKLATDGNNVAAGFLNNVGALGRDGSNSLAGFLNGVGALARDGSNVSAGFLGNVSAVGYTAQTLTQAQRAQAQGNIGALGRIVTNKTATFNVLAADAGTVFTVDTTGGAVVANLPTAAAIGNGGQLTFKRTTGGTNLFTIDGNGAETIDGAATLVQRMQNEAVTIESNGSNWIVVHKVAAVEQGSNGNGDFERHSNGKLYCWRTISLNPPATVSTFVTATLDWPYPFAATPRASTSLGAPAGQAVICTTIDPTTTSYTAGISSNIDIPSQNIYIRGEGTWF